MLAGSVVELLLLSAPSWLYRAWLRRRGTASRQASAAIGLRAGPVRDYAWAALVLVVTAGLGYAALKAIPAGELTRRGVVVGAAHSIAGYLALVVDALAEEMLFRGLIAGLLARRLGFLAGNTLQALLFLAPHGLLLLLSPTLWPILPVQLIAGWLLGWLRLRSGSIGPAWLAHAGRQPHRGARHMNGRRQRRHRNGMPAIDAKTPQPLTDQGPPYAIRALPPRTVRRHRRRPGLADCTRIRHRAAHRSPSRPRCGTARRGRCRRHRRNRFPPPLTPLTKR